MTTDPVQSHQSIEPDKDHNKVVTQMALLEAGPVHAPFFEAVFVVMGR